MIAQDGEGRRIQAPELFGIAALQDRPQMKVHDIPPEEDEVRTLGIDQVDPAGELRPAVPIPQVQVARQDEGQGLVQRLLRGDGHLLAVLVPVVDPARHKDGGDEARHAQESGQAVGKEGLGEGLAQGQDVCNDEGEQWMPLFTSREEMGELAESNEVVEVPIREILERLCDDPALAGLVINPETDKFAIDRDGVKYLLEEVDAFEAMTEDDEGIDIDEEE